MLVVTVDTSAVQQRLPRGYIRVLKWLLDIGTMVAHIEDSCKEQRERIGVWFHTQETVVEKVGSRGFVVS